MTNIDNVLEDYIVYSNQYDDTILSHLNDGEVHTWTYSDIPTLAEIVAKAHDHAVQRTTAAEAWGDLRERLVVAERRINGLTPAYDEEGRVRLSGKAEGVRLAISYVDEALRAARLRERG